MLTLIHSDRAVVRKVLAGNPGAFRVLVDRYGGVVHSVAYSRLRNAADAEDVAQETFIRFYQQLDQMAHRWHVGAWLVRVARNASVDLLRRRLREAARLCEDKRQAAQAHVPDPMREELHRLLWEQMEKLDPDAHEVLVLHYFMKKKAREIAALLDIKTNTVEKRLQRAREELGRRLTDLLGEEVVEVKTDARRGDRIMTAVCAAPVAWKASAAGAAAAATVAGVATGAGAAKLATGVALVAIMAIIAYLGYERYASPFKTQDITARSAVTVEDTAQDGEDAKAAGVAEPVEKASESNDAAVKQADATLPVYPPVFGTLTGTVRMDDGTPAAGAQVQFDNQGEVDVFLHPMFSAYGRVPVDLVKLTARTDSAGSFQISEVPIDPGRCHFFNLSAQTPGYFGQAQINVYHAVREMEQDLTLYLDSSVGGIVKGIEGKPVKEIWVLITWVEGSRATNGGGVVTQAGGRFLFEHVPAGLCQFSVDTRGYLKYRSQWISTGSRDHVLQLDPGNSVSGKVVESATGQPVGDVVIKGAGVGNDYAKDNYKLFAGQADSAGLFTITGCQPGTYNLSVNVEDYAPLPLRLVEPLTVTLGTDPVTGLELKMATGAVLRGKVIDDETGSPAPPGCLIVISNKDDSFMRGCETTAGGLYELLGLRDGELRVRVRGLSLRWRGDTSVTLKPGEVKQYDIHLSPRRLMTGTVVDESGQAVAGASVSAITPSEARLAGDAVSDVAGRFSLETAPPDQCPLVYVQALAEGSYSGLAGPYKTADTHSGIVLKVVRSGRLEGEVVDQDGQPVQNGLLAAVPESDDSLLPRESRFGEINTGKSINKLLDKAGEFVYPRLRPGTYALEVYTYTSGTRTPIAATEAIIQAGRTTKAHLVVDLTGFGGIEGTVLKDGQPAVGQEIQVTPVKAKWVDGLMAVTDANGQYAVYPIAPGEVYVLVQTPSLPGYGGIRKQETAEIVAGQVARLDFDFAGGAGTAEGYVTEDGLPARDATVTFNSVDSTGVAGLSATVDAAGWYQIEQIPEGAYNVEARLGKKMSQTVEAQVTPAQTARVDFEFVGCEIHGTISGLGPDEKAFVGLFPGDAQLPEWTVEALDALGEQMVTGGLIEQNGPFSFEGIQEGDYVVGAVALPSESQAETEQLLGGRAAVSPLFHTAPGTPAEVNLAFE